MNEIAFFSSTTQIYYTAIIVGFGIIAAIVYAVLLRWYARAGSSGLLCTVAGSMILAPFFSRLFYWYCSYEQFDGFGDALATPSRGGYSLLGSMVGVLTACVIVRAIGLVRSLPALLDCLAPAAALGIGIGRLAGFFGASDKGKMIYTDKDSQGLPVSVMVYDQSSGAQEWRFATFYYEALAGLVICVATTLLFIELYKNINNVSRTGDVFLVFISLYGASQMVLESTRYDALFLRSNGFISLMQIASIIMLMLPVVIFSIRGIRGGGLTKTYIICWVAVLILIESAVYLEYYVQRYADTFELCYSMMITFLMMVSTITMWLRSITAEIPIKALRKAPIRTAARR